MKNTKLSHQIAVGAIITFLGMVLGKGLTYLYVALIARLGSSEYGLLSLGFTITSFLVGISMLGLNTGLTRYIPFFIGKNNNKKIKGTILSSIKISFPISLFFMTALILFADKISINFFHNPNLIPILKLFSFTIPLIVLSNIFASVMLGFKKVAYQVVINEVIENIVKLFLTFILIYFSYNLFGAAIAYLISIITTFILSLYFVQNKTFKIFNSGIKTEFITKELLKFSLPLFFAGLFTLIIKWGDILLIGYFKTASDVGIYNATLATANLLTLVPAALIILFLPIITNLYSKKNKKEINKVSVRTSKWIFFCNLPIFIVLLIFSKDILRIMFGNEYVIGTASFIILLLGYIIHSLSHINSSILIMLKKTKIVFYIGFVTSLFSIIINLLLIPRYGIIGGAIGTSFALILDYLIYAFLAYRFTGIFIIRPFYFKFIISALLSALVIYLLKDAVTLSIIGIIILSIIFSFIYLILNILLKSFDKEDKYILSSFYDKFLRKG
ncbi:MAG: Polysaccharide biosynthesis protein [archaeon GW2011_AR20]|nr:MAG: Polysaccharide biosynthesis protein [archaeon GW2011_AR20]AQS28186.1 hypothetical protein [uncultured archaeon]MBS3160520.1 flippase [Candidatus Woesearchaeota archaeon]